MNRFVVRTSVQCLSLALAAIAISPTTAAVVRAGFQTFPSDSDPPKSPLKRGTLTEFSPLKKGDLGGSPSLKTRPTIAKSLPQIAENSKLKPLTETEVSQRLQALPNWTRDGKNIKYTHEFKNFVHAVSFVNCLISPSEKAGHHPDIFIAYNRVTISLTTHDAGGLTTQDFELAETISKLVSEWMPGNVCLVVEGSGS
jgi:4a-hydroxytetrahydrobiopterin dehydratase